MRRILMLAVGLMVSLIVAGCGAAPVADVTRSGAPEAPMALPIPTAAPAQPAYGEADSAAGGVGNIPAAQGVIERMVVYTGFLSLQVNDTSETVEKVETLLKGVNGYIASKSLSADARDKLRGTITIRIPAAAMGATLEQIKALGVKVLREDAQSNDVTSEYVNLDARRLNLEKYEVEFQKLLETTRESTGKAEDILAVYDRLTTVRGEIDQIRGQQNYLENTSALATYTVELVPVEEVVVEGEPGWDPGRTAGGALDSLVSALQGLSDLAITLALFVLPVLLVIALPFVLVTLILVAIIRRRSAKKSAVTA